MFKAGGGFAFCLFGETEVGENHIFRTVSIAGHQWLHKLLCLIDADNDRFPNGCAFRVVAVVELQGIPDMKAVALCQLFRNHAHVTILHTDHAPFFHCHIAGQNIEIQFHLSVSQQGDTTNIVILVNIGIFDPGKVDRIDWCDFCRYIVVRNTWNSSKFFDIVHEQGIKGIVGSHIPLGAVGGFQLTNVNTVQLPFI